MPATGSGDGAKVRRKVSYSSRRRVRDFEPLAVAARERITGPRGEEEPPRPARYDVFSQDDLGVEYAELYEVDNSQ